MSYEGRGRTEMLTHCSLESSLYSRMRIFSAMVVMFLEAYWWWYVRVSYRGFFSAPPCHRRDQSVFPGKEMTAVFCFLLKIVSENHCE